MPHVILATPRPTKLEVLAAYELLAENAIGDDYVTEKFFDPLIAGSVPVYLGDTQCGAPGTRRPCYINTADFANPKALGEYLLALHEDATARGRHKPTATFTLHAITHFAPQDCIPEMPFCAVVLWIQSLLPARTSTTPLPVLIGLGTLLLSRTPTLTAPLRNSITDFTHFFCRY